MSKTSYIIIIAVSLVIVAAGGYYWVTTQPPSTVQIQQKGSDTLLVLAQNWAEYYILDNSNVEIVVSGGGSGTGISALINKQIDIADASRQIKQTEIDAAKEVDVNPVEWKVALDGISLIVNSENPVDELSYNQLRGIYNGSITNWSEVGGIDAPVITYGRQSTSGTYVYFNEEVLDEDDYRADMNQMAGNADIVEAVINDPNGIGYVGVAYAEARKDELKIASVKRQATSQAYQPTSVDIANGNYPVSRYLYVYTNGIPEGAVKDYIKFMLSSEGQGVVVEVGYIDLPQSILTEQLNKLD
jgi:phosphate transport system substrate-binding protein